MDKEKIANTVQAILIQHFDIQPDDFYWEKSLEELDANFKVLGHLVSLKQLLEQEFGKELPILENITTGYHTPKDVVTIIKNR